jgi:hypothetical protein
LSEQFANLATGGPVERQLAFFKVFSSLPSVRGLLSYYLNHYAFAPPAVEFAIENLFPGPEIQTAVGNCDDDFPPMI